MAFCTGCGSQMRGQFAFCPKCGTPAEPEEPKEPEEPLPAAESQTRQNGDRTKPEPAASAEPPIHAKRYVPAARPGIDRKTLFADGMLVLTHEDLILYSPDELDELMRIPVAKIASCSRGMMRRSLVVKVLANVEENFARHLEKTRDDMDKTNAKIEKQRERLKEADSPEKKRAINVKISDLEAKSRKMSGYMERLQTDPAEIEDAKRRKADTTKETFHLPKGYSADTAESEEYAIWEYAIRRSMAGPSVLRVDSSPPEAVVLVDGAVAGNTPVTLDMPLTEKAALSGRYDVRVLLEGHESKRLRVNAAPGSAPKVHQISLRAKGDPDPELDGVISEYRGRLPDRTIDLEEYDMEMETAGVEGVLALARDHILLLSKDRTRWLLEIPYRDVTDARLEKRLMRGIRGIAISYKEKSLGGLECRFEMDTQSIQYEGQAVRRRYEALVDKVLRRMAESHAHTYTPRPPPHSHRYYEITESDIEGDYDRFDPYSFEVLVARLFTCKGYKTQVTQGSGDMGVDVVASNSSEIVVIQVKKWNANVGGPDVHKTLGSMVSHHATRALVVTTSDFTKQAYKIRDGGSPVELWNGQRLANEFRRHLVGTA